MINYKYIGIAILLIVFGAFRLTKNKYYKRKEKDMLWAAESNVFWSYVVLIFFGILIIFYELKKFF
ncbi:hypothetical protein SAMN05444005_10776 [Flavobacterium urocaniciphilum]|uniref:Uncharacterized protein n=1 Tax=Flavobacterium urocaniciphilum TaxID=1299341 RepID=A0A1H9DL88_9FLAO|nr:hypothetical protein SAMN05444005_10776 [Flavobacterium urocaniciphilum]